MGREACSAGLVAHHIPQVDLMGREPCSAGLVAHQIPQVDPWTVTVTRVRSWGLDELAR